MFGQSRLLRRILCLVLAGMIAGCATSGLRARVEDVAATTRAQFTASPTQVADSAEDEAMRERVEAALRFDPYFYDVHVTVTVDKGEVLLGGIVSSDWDLIDAMRIARAAAPNRVVVDNLSIELGGRK